jgi:hypothetical protein
MLKKILLLCFFLAIAACSKLEKQESFKELSYDYFGSFKEKWKECLVSGGFKSNTKTCENLDRIDRHRKYSNFSTCFNNNEKTVNRVCVDAFAKEKGYDL